MSDMPYTESEWEQVKDKVTGEEKVLWSIFGEWPSLRKLRSRTPEQVERLKQRELDRQRERDKRPRRTPEQIMGSLAPQERKVIDLRFGLKDGQIRTLVATGKEIGRSTRTVSRIQARALEKLRHSSRQV